MLGGDNGLATGKWLMSLKNVTRVKPLRCCQLLLLFTFNNEKIQIGLKSTNHLLNL